MHSVECTRQSLATTTYTAAPAEHLAQAGLRVSLKAILDILVACRRRWTSTSRACMEARGRSRSSLQRVLGSSAWRLLQGMVMELCDRSGQGLRPGSWLAAWLPDWHPQMALRSPVWRSSS